MSRWHLLSLFIFTFAVTVTIGMFLVGGSDEGAGNDEAAAPPAPTATQPPPAPTEALAVAQPVQVQLHVDAPGDLAARIHTEAQALAAEMGVVLVLSQSAETDGVVVSRAAGDAPAGVAVIERWVAVASTWSLRESVALTPEPPFELLLSEESRKALEPVLGEVALGAAVRWLPTAEIAPTLAADTTAVALVPIADAVSLAGLRLLHIESEPEPWLAQRLRVVWSDEAQKDFALRLAERIDTPAPVMTTIAFTGDMMAGRCVYERQRNLDDYTAAFAFMKDYLASADVTVGSLDGSLSDVGAPFACEPTFNLLGPPESIEGYAAAGFDVITVATNHAKDCGSYGFGCSDSIRDTLALLREAGIQPVGGGENLAEARQPIVIERNGVRFAFLAYDDIATIYYGATETIPGTAPLTEEYLREDIAVAKSMADIVTVLPHWGIEYTPHPSDRQVYLAQVALEAGAALVIGNHPHVVQGLEPGAGTFVAYALGNFVFDQDWSIETLQGAVLEATFAGSQLLSVTLRPHRIVNMFQPSFAEPDEARVILDRMHGATEVIAEQ